MNIRPHRALKAGRYVLDQHGRLHPYRHRHSIEVVALVRVKAKRKITTLVPRGTPTADRAGGCDGRAAAVSTRPAAERDCNPARQKPGNARQPHTKINLSNAPSSLEERAAAWRGNR